MKENTRRTRWFTIINAIICSLTCCYLEDAWYFKAMAIFAGMIIAVCMIVDLHLSKGEEYNDYMYRYFQEVKRKGKVNSAVNNPWIRVTVRGIMMILLVYISVRCTYHEFTINGKTPLIQVVLSLVMMLALWAPINIFWVWKIESKMK